MSIEKSTLTGAPETTDEHEEMIQILDELISEELRKFIGDGRIRDNKKKKFGLST